jgi:hypothetical protein
MALLAGVSHSYLAGVFDYQLSPIFGKYSVTKFSTIPPESAAEE